MRVMCVFDFEINPYFEGNGECVRYGEIYTVKEVHSGHCLYLNQVITAYEFYELPNYYDTRIFIPVSEIDEMELTEKFVTNKQT